MSAESRLCPDVDGWPEFIRTATLQDRFYEAARNAGVSRRGWATELGLCLPRLCPQITKKRKLLPLLDKHGQEISSPKKQQWVYLLPDLQTCRTLFDNATSTTHPWPNVEEKQPPKVKIAYVSDKVCKAKG